MTTTKRTLPALAAALAFTAGIAARPASAQDAAKGALVYGAQKCQTCHMIGGKGNKSNPLDGVGAKLSAEDIREWIVKPADAAAKAKSTKKPVMPNKYGSLPAADIDNLVAYMQSLK